MATHRSQGNLTRHATASEARHDAHLTSARTSSASPMSGGQYSPQSAAQDTGVSRQNALPGNKRPRRRVPRTRQDQGSTSSSSPQAGDTALTDPGPALYTLSSAPGGAGAAASCRHHIRDREPSG